MTKYLFAGVCTVGAHLLVRVVPEQLTSAVLSAAMFVAACGFWEWIKATWDEAQ